MKLRIRHSTRYRYRRPVTLNAHRLMLFPRGNHELALVTASLACSPQAALAWSQDIFGNLVATATFAEPADTLLILSEMTVEQSAPPWQVFRIAPAAHAFPFDYDDAERGDLCGLLSPHYPDPDGALTAWARSFVAGTPTDTLSLLKDINAGMLPRVAYRIRDEEGTQSPLETLSLASGSCRDIAALFIDVVRHLGFGARAVSGYVHDPQAMLGDAGSTHAWAEVYLPGAGWIAFDPTHRRVGSAGLLPIAYGRCNSRIMPVTGGYAGEARDFVAMEVDVRVEEVAGQSVSDAGPANVFGMQSTLLVDQER
jgi:transglutaminase-like putative cysteine protease